ncbi:MAG: hypothetical protein ACRC5T_02395 [Cetobacterium sp.]
MSILKNLRKQFLNTMDYINYLEEIMNEVSSEMQIEISTELTMIKLIEKKWQQCFEEIEVIEPNYTNEKIELVPVSNDNKATENLNNELEQYKQAYEMLEITSSNEIEFLNQKIKDIKIENRATKKDYVEYYKNELEIKDLYIKELEIKISEMLLNNNKPVKKVVNSKIKSPTELDNEKLYKKLQKIGSLKINTTEEDVNHLELVGTLNKDEMNLVFEANNYTTKKQIEFLEYVVIHENILASDSYQLYRGNISKKFNEQIVLHMNLIKAIKEDYKKFGTEIKFFKSGNSLTIFYADREINIALTIENDYSNFKDVIEFALKNDNIITLDVETLKIKALKDETTIINDSKLNLKQILQAIKLTNNNIYMNYKKDNSATMFKNEEKLILIMPLHQKD